MLRLGEWAELLHDVQPELEALVQRVEQRRRETTVYPSSERMFAALTETPPSAVRVVILGQDPYHEPGQAMGLAFSVERGVRIPPSLRNIYRELESDLGIQPPAHGDLTAWAQRGVLLLNTVLTVEKGRANSHSTWGWQRITDAIVRATNLLPQPVVYFLWGAQAQQKAALIAEHAGQRRLLFAPHPSPLSAYRGFFGSRPFSQANRFLCENNQPPIDWRLE